MTSRAQQVEQLLRSLNDWLPGPATHRGNPLSMRQASGEVQSLEVVCATCGGKGKLRGNMCGVCRGHGSRIVDVYTGEETALGHEGPRAQRRIVKCDSCAGAGVYGNGRRCAYCDGVGVVHVPSGSSQEAPGRDAAGRVRVTVVSAFEERRMALMRSGSYAELEVALARLEVRFPVLHRAVVKYLVDGDYVSREQEPRERKASPMFLSPPVRELLDEACELLAGWMPAKIRVPRRAAQEPVKGKALNGHRRGQRDAEIRRLRDEGLSLQKIAERVGVSRQRVHKVVGM